MNTSLILVLAIISIVAILLFWAFYSRANSTQKLSEKYLLKNLKDQSLSSEQRSEFEQQLSNLLQRSSQSSSSFKISFLVAIFVVPFSFYFYTLLGNPEAVDYVPQNSQQASQQGQNSDQPQMSMQEAITQLETRLASNPDDVDGQMLYARSQISLKNYPKAVAAYRKANQLAPDEAVVLTELAEAIALANNNRSFLGEPEELLAKAVSIEPNSQKALWLLGMTFYERKNFTKTNELWSKLYDLMKDEGAKKQLAEQLAGVRNQLGLEPIENAKTTEKPESDSTINININIDEMLIDKLNGSNALLYVYTKATKGMPMPIAVIKKPLAEITFPVTVSLSDLNNLQATRTLSSFENIAIGARISFGGNAIAQPGDLQSEELIIKLPYSDTVKLLIDKVK